MILIGQYDSPFVRRVAIALHLYAIAYEHRPWSTFGDTDRIARFNPLREDQRLKDLHDGEAMLQRFLGQQKDIDRDKTVPSAGPRFDVALATLLAILGICLFLYMSAAVLPSL